MLTINKRESREPIKRGAKRKELQTIYHCSTTLSQRKETPWKGPLHLTLKDLDMQIQGL